MQAVATEAETVWFTTTRARILVRESTYSLIEEEARQGDMPPLHVHHGHDEVFYVMSGHVSIHLPGSRIDLGSGQAAFAPRGVPHTYRVESEEGARWLVATTSGAFAEFVAEVAVPAEDDGYAPAEVIPARQDLAAAAARAGIDLLGPPGTFPNLSHF
jgi:mannose-6-phosphate isomerase-like protein (cupin superfamily)